MQVVTVHQGKFSIGKEKFRDFTNVTFPLHDGTIGTNHKGKYIQVDGVPVRGFPKRIIKVFINSQADFTISEGNAQTVEQANKASKVVRAPKQTATVENGAVDEAQFVAKLNGPDDAKIKARIAECFEVMDYLVQSAADGQINGAIFSGPPGISKSTSVEQSIMRAIEQPDVVKRLQWKPKFPGDQMPAIDPTKYKDQFDLRVKWVSGKVSPVGFYELLYKVSEARSVLVLDDTDCVLQDETMIGFMKIAMDTSGKPRVMTWSSAYSNRMEAPSRFVFKGTIIIITNINFEAQSQKENSLTEHLNALMDRTYYLDLTIHTLREKYLWIEHMCRDKGILENIGLAPLQVSEVMSYFKNNILKFRHVSIRTVEKIGRLCMTHGNWQRMCEATLFSSKSMIAQTRTADELPADSTTQAADEGKSVQVTDISEPKIVDLTSLLAEKAEAENPIASAG